MSAVPPLLLLAGTSEAGKSTAGQHLAECGAARLKIRTILLTLTSGVEAHHEGVATREGFDHSEFLAALITTVTRIDRPIVVVESFIDTDLARRVQAGWANECRILFITADVERRIARHAAANQLTVAESARIVEQKDTRKRVFEQLDRWRQLADHWIENHGPVEHLRTTLEQIMASTLLTTTTRSAE